MAAVLSAFGGHVPKIGGRLPYSFLNKYVAALFSL